MILTALLARETDAQVPPIGTGNLVQVFGLGINVSPICPDYKVDPIPAGNCATSLTYCRF
jgi:hypothetical protein